MAAKLVSVTVAAAVLDSAEVNYAKEGKIAEDRQPKLVEGKPDEGEPDEGKQQKPAPARQQKTPPTPKTPRTPKKVKAPSASAAARKQQKTPRKNVKASSTPAAARKQQKTSIVKASSAPAAARKQRTTPRKSVEASFAPAAAGKQQKAPRRNVKASSAGPHKKQPNKSKAPPPHPPYLQMIVAAILALKERNGSSQYAIAKYIEQEYGSDLPANFKRILSSQLRNLSNEGRLRKIKNSFKLSDELKKVAAKTFKDQQNGSDQMVKLPAPSKESKTLAPTVKKRTPSKIVIPIAPTGYTSRRKGSSTHTATAKTGSASSKNPSPPPSSKHKKSSAAAATASNKKGAYARSFSAGAKPSKRAVKDIGESPRTAKSGGPAKSQRVRKTPAKKARGR